MRHLSKSLRTLLLILFLGFLGSFLIYYLLDIKKESVVSPNNDFTAITNSFLKKQLEKDTLGLHYTIADPENLGIEYSVTLPLWSETAENETYLQYENLYSALQEIKQKQLSLENSKKKSLFIHSLSKGSLSTEEQYTLDLLLHNLPLLLEGKEYPFYEEYFSPTMGVQVQYPILMAEYTFRSKKDVEDYLTLLSQTNAYFQSLLEYEKQKSQQGLFMSNASASAVISQCGEIISLDSLKNNAHFLQTSFHEKLAGLQEKKILSEKESADFICLHDKVLLEQVYPAYQSLAQGLSSLVGSCTNEQGLCYFPKGRDYYEWLVKTNTGSSKSMAEIQKLLLIQYQTLEKKLQVCKEKLQQNSNLTEITFPVSSPEEMLQKQQNFCKQDFPSLSSVQLTPGSNPSFVSEEKGGKMESALIKPVTSGLEAYTAPAFYVNTPLDSKEEHSIYINYSSTKEGLDLYTTLAHEGYPGHLYQSAYYHGYQSIQGVPLIRNLFHFGGYTEGWGVYSELAAFDQAVSLFPTGLQAYYKPLYDYLKTERELQLCLLSLLDLQIHWEGLSPERAKTALALYGIEDREKQDALYQYIVEAPANYLKYYIGYLEILETKEKAKSLWKQSYSDLAFHTFFLNAGPSDFTTVRRRFEQ